MVPVLLEDHYRPIAWLDWVNADALCCRMRSIEEVDERIEALMIEICRRTSSTTMLARGAMPTVLSRCFLYGFRNA